jgi:hypothetical protein
MVRVIIGATSAAGGFVDHPRGEKVAQPFFSTICASGGVITAQTWKL